MEPEIFDREAFAKRCVYDEELQEEIIRGSLPDVAAHVSAVEEAFERGDPNALERSAHALKGSCGTLSAIDLRETAREIEMAAKEANFSAETAQQVRSLRTKDREFREHLRDAGFDIS
jgi:HPt (histidine-containing phosphotransfer) domain-containing protein